MRYLIVFLFALCFVACQQNDSIVPDVAKSSKEYSVSDKSVTRAFQTYREPTNEEKQVLSTDFPYLNTDRVMVTDEANPLYNCIAYSMGLEDRWIDPESPLSSFQQQYQNAKILYYAPNNYSVTSTLDYNADVDGWGTSDRNMTHGSKRYSGTTWESKLGRYLRITHDRLGLMGNLYGDVQTSFNISNSRMSEIARTIEMDTLTMSDKEKIKKLASQVPDSIRSRFSILVDKWNFAIDHNPKTRYSASTYSYAGLPEFNSLKSMGEQIIPLIMERLINPSDFYLLVLYEAVQNDSNQKITYKNGDFHILEGEQNRAIRCVKKWLEQLK